MNISCRIRVGAVRRDDLALLREWQGRVADARSLVGGSTRQGWLLPETGLDDSFVPWECEPAHYRSDSTSEANCERRASRPYR